MLRKAGAYKEREGSLEGRGEGQAGQGNFLFLLILVSSFVVIFSLDARVRDGRALGAEAELLLSLWTKIAISAFAAWL